MSKSVGVAVSAVLVVTVVILPCIYPWARDATDIISYTVAAASLWLAAILSSATGKDSSRPAFSPPDLFLVIYLAYCTINILVRNADIPSLTWIKWTAASGAYIVGKQIGKKWMPALNALVLVSLIQSTLIFLQFSGLLHSLSFFFKVSGSFGNPAPAAALLATTVSLLIPFVRDSRIALSVAIYCLAAMLLCDSRAAIFAVVVVSLFVLSGRTAHKHKFIVAAVIILSVIILYFVRTGSANVRLLIWASSLNIMDDNVLFGSGCGSFSARYMFAQAEYFSANPCSPLIQYANNHHQAYNEIVHLVSEQGIVGLMMFLCFLGAILKQKGQAKTGVISFVALSMFLNISDIFILFVSFWLCSGACASASARKSFKALPNNAPLITACIAAILCTIPSATYAFHHKDAPVITYESTCKSGEEYMEAGKIEEAEKCFKLAAQMIPHRLSAHYNLFLIYREIDPPRAVEEARLILSLPVEKATGKALGMLREAEIYYSNNHHISK